MRNRGRCLERFLGLNLFSKCFHRTRAVLRRWSKDKVQNIFSSVRDLEAKIENLQLVQVASVSIGDGGTA